MNWFSHLTGFTETGYDDTRRKLEVAGPCLRSLVNGNEYGIGHFDLVSLEDLRTQTTLSRRGNSRLVVRVLQGDVRQLHQSPEFVGALFQVASQFNMLEMTSPERTPEDGVTRYQYDPTQGPACAIAAGAATIFRNYFVPVAGFSGQTSERQLDGLSAVGVLLETALRMPVASLWQMRNGYAMCTRAGLHAISQYIESSPSEALNALRGRLCIGLHRDVEVTDASRRPGPTVSQAFCSALPIAYSTLPEENWRTFASFILDAAYEATMWAAVHNMERGASRIVLLTSLGGGAFGNRTEWIIGSIRRALSLVASFDLDVRLVSHGAPSQEIAQLARDFS